MCGWITLTRYVTTIQGMYVGRHDGYSFYRIFSSTISPPRPASMVRRHAMLVVSDDRLLFSRVLPVRCVGSAGVRRSPPSGSRLWRRHQQDPRTTKTAYVRLPYKSYFFKLTSNIFFSQQISEQYFQPCLFSQANRATAPHQR
jgi:hypothetical protein